NLERCEDQPGDQFSFKEWCQKPGRRAAQQTSQRQSFHNHEGLLGQSSRSATRVVGEIVKPINQESATWLTQNPLHRTAVRFLEPGLELQAERCKHFG